MRFDVPATVVPATGRETRRPAPHPHRVRLGWGKGGPVWVRVTDVLCSFSHLAFLIYYRLLVVYHLSFYLGRFRFFCSLIGLRTGLKLILPIVRIPLWRSNFV